MAVSAIFGSSVKRVEDPRMITGRGKYTEDTNLPGTVYATFLRSPYANAMIKKIDVSRALTSPGVIAVYTGKDLAGKLSPVPCAWPVTNADIRVPPYLPITTDHVRYQGDPVCVVVAEDRYRAKDAVELIDVEYEVLPVVVDQERAVEKGAPLLYTDVPNNIAFHWNVVFGDADSAIRGADVVIRKRFVNQRLQPTAMETRGAVASYEPGTESLTVWMTSQNPHIHRFLLSAMTGIPEHKLRVMSNDVGGGFGSKIPCHGPEAVVAVLAKELKRPVKWIEDRSENYHATTHGRDHIDYVELAAKKDGTITGLRVKTYANMGAWLSTAAPGVPTILFGLVLGGPYRIQNVSCEVFGVLTNTTAIDAYRGAGRPEATYILERAIDMLSRELKMDPAEVRRKNFIPEDAFPYAAATGLIYDSGNYTAALEKAMEAIGYRDFRKTQAKLRQEGKLIGMGISSYVEMCGLGPSGVVRSTGFGLGLWDSTTVRVHPSGKVSVFTGGHPHGQGEETTFAQIAASELGTKLEDVEVIHGDTDRIPFGMGSYGSRTTAVAGSAIAIACRRIKDKGRKIAAFLLDTREENVQFESGVFQVTGMPEMSKNIADVALASYAAGGLELPAGMEPGLESTTFFDPPNFTFPFGTHICIAEVERETGEVRIRRYVAVDDCGNQINPMIVEGQIHGGIAQGIGQALLEETLYDERGNLMTGALGDYSILGAVEMPLIETFSTCTPSPSNPIGVKGIGEAGTIASTPAVVNAVIDAIQHLGVEHIDMPLKPEKVWNAVNRRGMSGT